MSRRLTSSRSAVRVVCLSSPFMFLSLQMLFTSPAEDANFMSLICFFSCERTERLSNLKHPNLKTGSVRLASLNREIHSRFNSHVPSPRLQVTSLKSPARPNPWKVKICGIFRTTTQYSSIDLAAEPSTRPTTTSHEARTHPRCSTSSPCSMSLTTRALCSSSASRCSANRP